jgi:hypothetical protein
MCLFSWISAQKTHSSPSSLSTYNDNKAPRTRTTSPSPMNTTLKVIDKLNKRVHKKCEAQARRDTETARREGLTPHERQEEDQEKKRVRLAKSEAKKAADEQILSNAMHIVSNVCNVRCLWQEIVFIGLGEVVRVRGALLSLQVLNELGDECIFCADIQEKRHILTFTNITPQSWQ